ncbi:hypothetical protein [Pseudarthrobacter raffinosi]|uniref:hypothetical protein n=1 Tax=Pseudarthrobacter raffinosi TaxID=2953651 RepID=UPI00208FFA1F|nr:hypothetical protein [Pseudarthrobacter sp. MDT3-9]MCO4253599.1 hypothetical protein [Pseudarthrobacter sp. MDT3-9]
MSERVDELPPGGERAGPQAQTQQGEHDGIVASPLAASSVTRAQELPGVIDADPACQGVSAGAL